LEALREELRRVSKQIEEAEQQRVLQETLQLGCAKREGNPSPEAEGRTPVRAYLIEQGFGVCRDLGEPAVVSRRASCALSEA
jgi:hypothetical protein